jgi:acyl-CoA thioester hydrolase
MVEDGKNRNLGSDVGLTPDFPYAHQLTVRFRDCDAQGHVNNAVYFTYLEQCRLTFWRELTGGAASPLARVIVARAEWVARAAAFFGDAIEIRLKVGDIGNSSFHLIYEMVNLSSGKRLADARTVMVTYDYEAGRPVPMPDRTRVLLEGYRGPETGHI